MAPQSPQPSGTSDTWLFTCEGHCLDTRSSRDLPSGGDLSKGHPNYQTSTRGRAMQRVVIRGPRSEGGARRCLPRLAGAKAPTRQARTPGHANRTAVTRRPTRPVMEIGDTDSGRISQHRAPAEPAPCSKSRGHVRRYRSGAARESLAARVSGATYPLCAADQKTSARPRRFRWQAGPSWIRVRP